MSKFKGTKGTDNEQFFYAFNILFPDHDDVINHFEQGKVEGFRIGYKKALEDSKAPEMLEMLKTLLDNSDVPNEIYDQAKQLIQEATTI